MEKELEKVTNIAPREPWPRSQLHQGARGISKIVSARCDPQIIIAKL